MRVYWQVQEWQGELLDPEQWGWELKYAKCVHIQTNLAAAPQEILHVV